MSVDAQDFRQALARFASGVTVVNTRVGSDRPLGVTVSAFTSVSLDPPLVLVCLDQNTLHLDAYISGISFNISVLSSKHKTISDRFAYADSMSPFDTVSHFDGENGIPLLSDALVQLECSRFDSHQAGDHTVLIGEVQRANWREEGEPLLYWRGQYRSLNPEQHS